MVNFWNVETLSSEEIKCLLIAFDKILKEVKVKYLKTLLDTKILSIGIKKRIRRSSKRL